MNPKLIDLSSNRAAKARLASSFGKNGYKILVSAGTLLLIVGVVLGVSYGLRYLLFLIAPALLCFMPAIWWKYDLWPLIPSGTSVTDRLSREVLALLKPGTELNPNTVWQAVSGHWQTNFFLNHLLLDKKMVGDCMSNNPQELEQALKFADQLTSSNGLKQIELGFLVAGLMSTSPKLNQALPKLKLKNSDIESIANWLARNISEVGRKQSFGGVARDWTFGFTPLLDNVGLNISRSIMDHGANFSWLMGSPGVIAVEGAFANHANAVVLVGPDGIGKTQSVYALAQKLIEGNTNRELAYHQIVALNATDILSRARSQGDLERVMLSVANEAAHAGHVILFFDDAQLFLNNNPGSFDGSQILLSIVQSHSVPVIMAMSPNDYQRLKSTNSSLAGMLTPVMLQELDESGVMHVLEDFAIGLEYRNKVLVSYGALVEAYRLSGRYEQEEAYPGKAVKLLEQSIPHAEGSIVTAASVQAAIEQTKGVKASSATVVEADQLLHLEEAIHARMINQDYAVKVVSDALRRARAGVTNPNRPIGSFLFLGPTGVGKTELAKAVAAIYFGRENSMVRLDMSEYSGEQDVHRLLDSGQNKNDSLIMSVRQSPFTVVLLDEIEKAHPLVLNLLLQLLDEGKLTDSNGRQASFKDCIIIATSNAAAKSIRQHIDQGESLADLSGPLTDELINSGQFKPELLNRFDEIVFFRPLTSEELGKVVLLLVAEVNKTLSNQNISVELTSEAVRKIVSEGNDPRLGARPMRRMLQRSVENSVAQKILKGEVQSGDHIVLNESDLMVSHE